MIEENKVTAEEQAEGVEVVAKLEDVIRHFIDQSTDGEVTIKRDATGEGFTLSINVPFAQEG